MDTKDIFAELLVAESVTISGDPAELRSLYILLYRKFHSYKREMDNVGYLREQWMNATLGMSIAAGGTIATFTIKSKRKRGSFQILAIGGVPVGAAANGSKVNGREDQTSQDWQNVPAHLEHDQESTVQHGSTNQGTQEHGEDTDSSSAQGESSGVCNHEEDWRAHLRKFIEQDGN